MLHPFRACSEVVLMSTYEELSLIVSAALLIVAILNLKIRNSRPALVKV